MLSEYHFWLGMYMRCILKILASHSYDWITEGATNRPQSGRWAVRASLRSHEKNNMSVETLLSLSVRAVEEKTRRRKTQKFSSEEWRVWIYERSAVFNNSNSTLLHRHRLHVTSMKWIADRVYTVLLLQKECKKNELKMWIEVEI